jgi:predicted RNase H-like HicB family nuclease
MKSRYHINVFYSEEDKCYIADIPDLKYCSAHGETPEKALREVLIAQQLTLESMREARMRIPKVKYRPAVYELV